jgi:hypothetical protein
MSLRLALALIIIASWAGVGVAFLIENPPAAGKDPDPPFFYNLSSDDLRKITISAGGQSVTWVYRQDIRRWFFESPENVPANLQRWGGITTLLGGPKTQRVLEQRIDNEVKYGLDKPPLTISASLRDGTDYVLNIGSTTPNEGAHYARVVGYPQLVLVDSSWGNVLTRLVNEPPYPDWWYTMDPAKAAELLFYKKNEVVRAYGLNDDDGKWYVCDLPVVGDPCTGTKLADADAILSALKLIAARQINGAESLSLPEQADYVPFQATVDAPYLSIRIENVKQTNITEVTRTSMTIGGLTPDGKERYMVANETQDVVRADAAWANKILELFEGEPFFAKS